MKDVPMLLMIFGFLCVFIGSVLGILVEKIFAHRKKKLIFEAYKADVRIAFNNGFDDGFQQGRLSSYSSQEIHGL